jgi:hypothetical protein
MTMKRPVERDDEPNEVQTSLGEAVAPEPLAFTLDPASGPEHTPVLISGANFGDTLGTIALNEVPAPAVNWTPIAISTIVPYGAKTGDLVVITADGQRGSAPFTVTEK